MQVRLGHPFPSMGESTLGRQLPTFIRLFFRADNLQPLFLNDILKDRRNKQRMESLLTSEVSFRLERKVAQRLTGLAAFPEDLHLVPSTHMGNSLPP